VAKKFSLKDNPIFQRLEAPGPREAEPPVDEALPSEEASRPSDLIQEPSDEGHDMTVSHRPSEFDPQVLPLSKSSDQQAHVPVHSPQVQGSQSPLLSQDPGLKDHLDRSLFFSFFNEMVDDLLPTLDPNEQVLYIRLFRLSYGFNRNYCTVSQSLLIERTGFSRNTIRTSLQSLVQKGWIRIAEAGNRVSTTYRVILPRETRIGSPNSRVSVDRQNSTVRNRPSENDGHQMSRKIRGSGSNPPEGQNLALQDLTLTKRPSESSESTDTSMRRSDFEGQGLPPLLKAFTNNSLTLHTGERGLYAEGQNLPLSSLTLSARELVDKFYSRLGQRPSRAKREKSIEECLNLLVEGFTVEEVDYAIAWLIQQHPATGSFSRLSHFIDQAIKERQAEQRTRNLEQQQDREVERQWAERERIEEERQQIEEAKALLPPGTLEELYQEATRLVKQESPNLKIGKDLIIRLKLNELVKLRYLCAP
jgi:Helix-turn-helix domain